MALAAAEIGLDEPEVSGAVAVAVDVVVVIGGAGAARRT
jgi:hypothetical protein